MDNRVVKASEDQDKTARHYGRAYQCLRCLYKDDVERVDVKRRMEAHITKYHLSLDEVAHYCRLCNFRCWDRKTLEDHVKFYARHRRMENERGLREPENDYLVSNKEPYVIGAADYRVLSKERSHEFFKRKSSSARSTQEELPTDLVQEAAELSGIGVSASPSLNLVDIWLGDVEESGASETAAVPDLRPAQPQAATTSAAPQAEPLDLSVPSGEENILGQLLGESDARLTPVVDQPTLASLPRDLEPPSPKRKRHETAHKRPSRSRSVSPASSVASSRASSTSTSSISAEQWQEIGRAIVKPVCEAIDKNSKAIQDLGKSLSTLTQAVEVMARSCKGCRKLWRKE